MKPTSGPYISPPSSSTALFAAVLLSGMITYFAMFCTWNVVNVVRVDFLDFNPNRTRANAWSMIMLTPLFAGFVTAVLAPLPVFVGASGGAIAKRLSGRVPFWVFFLLAFICALTSYCQAVFFRYGNGDARDYVTAAPWHFGFRVLLWQIPFLTISYLWTLRKTCRFKEGMEAQVRR